MVAGTALKDRVDLVSVMVPRFQGSCKNYKQYVLKCFWVKNNLVRPNHECERERVVLVEHICTHMFFSLYIQEKLSLISCLNELILFVNFKSEDWLFHILASSRTSIFGQDD